MQFEWDDKKAEQNALKHGISFEMALFAFDDPYVLIITDEKHSADEHRQWLIGNAGEKILIIVFTMRLPKGNIRIISARRANCRERRLYEESKRV